MPKIKYTHMKKPSKAETDNIVIITFPGVMPVRSFKEVCEKHYTFDIVQTGIWVGRCAECVKKISGDSIYSSLEGEFEAIEKDYQADA